MEIAVTILLGKNKKFSPKPAGRAQKAAHRQLEISLYGIRLQRLQHL